MQYLVQIRKSTDLTAEEQAWVTAHPTRRGVWVHAETIEADCGADARKIARKRYKGQLWRIYRGRGRVAAVAPAPVAPQPELAPRPRRSGKK